MPEPETTIPDGLTKNTLPFEFSVPAIVDGMPGDVTRFRIAELASGRLKLAVLPAPTLKESQFTIARFVAAFTFMTDPACEIEACPATTSAPVGSCADAVLAVTPIEHIAAKRAARFRLAFEERVTCTRREFAAQLP
ncbi:hypothetical protein RE6C_00266 [Rhodopirellula europaea 6C]|uniref:Uncharacterized protein n=1 Tax=Rhodopirellula europaea 6C TaxID=1263867 RepID=M2APL2_9BACT|nr:hypothetical protein RE6C_00266 [Rhodopirellula europaea 6C]